MPVTISYQSNQTATHGRTAMPASDCDVVWTVLPSWGFDVRPPTEVETSRADKRAVGTPDSDSDD